MDAYERAPLLWSSSAISYVTVRVYGVYPLEYQYRLQNHSWIPLVPEVASVLYLESANC